MAERLMVNLGASLDKEVDRLAQQAGITKGEVVRQALRFYMPLEVAMTQGVTVLLIHADGRTEQFRPYSIHGSVGMASSLEVTGSFPPVTPLKDPHR